MDDDTKIKLKGLALAAVFVFLFGVVVYLLMNQPPLYRDVYSAYVIQKQTRQLETRNGGGVVWDLLVQDLNGERFHVRVSAQVFQQAQPGAFIEKRATDKDPTISP